MKMDVKLLFCFVLLCLNGVYCQKTDPHEVRCHVCKITVQEMEEAVLKVDPRKTTDVSGFRMDSSGNAVRKPIPLAKSEIYLTELMEDICNKLNDYAKVIYKKTGKLGVIKLTIDGAMNPDISEVNFVQDGDLNKSLQHYCLEILDDFEVEFLKFFMEDPLKEDIDIKICSETAYYCQDAPIPEEYNLEEDDLREEL